MDDELDGLRVRQIATAKRAAHRARSYALIGAFACAVILGQLIYLIITGIRTAGITRHIIAYVLMIPLLFFGMIYCFGKAKQYLTEAMATKLQESSHDPDFSTLSDGSQRWKDFDNIE